MQSTSRAKILRGHLQELISRPLPSIEGGPNRFKISSREAWQEIFGPVQWWVIFVRCSMNALPKTWNLHYRSLAVTKICKSFYRHSDLPLQSRSERTPGIIHHGPLEPQPTLTMKSFSLRRWEVGTKFARSRRVKITWHQDPQVHFK